MTVSSGESPSGLSRTWGPGFPGASSPRGCLGVPRTQGRVRADHFCRAVPRVPTLRPRVAFRDG